MSTDIKPGQVWAWSNGNRVVVVSVGSLQVAYQYLDPTRPDSSLGVHNYEISGWLRNLSIVAEDAPAPLDPSKKARVEIADWDDFQEFDVVVQMPGLDGGPFVVEREKPAPEPEPEYENGAVIRTAFSEYHMIAGEFVDIHDGGPLAGDPDVRPLVVIDPADVDLDALAKIWTETLAGGSNLTISPLGALWFEALRAVLAELGIEATR